MSRESLFQRGTSRLVNSAKVNGYAQTFKFQLTVLGGFVLLAWLLEIIDLLIFDSALNAYGIAPRELAGLRGVILAPFLHSGIGHVAANTIPFLILGWLVMMRDVREFVLVTLIVLLFSGLGVWLLGPSHSLHIGASGLVFGYLGYLLWRGFFERSVQAIIVALLVGFFYGGFLWGVLPGGNGVSWQSHLFGFIGGGVAAYVLNRRRQDEIRILPE